MRWVAGWADGDVVGEAMAPLPVDFVQSIHSIRVKCEPQWQSIQNKWVTDKVFIRLGLSWKKERVPGDFAAQTPFFSLFLLYHACQAFRLFGSATVSTIRLANW